jgi:hypothetical protein
MESKRDLFVEDMVKGDGMRTWTPRRATDEEIAIAFGHRLGGNCQCQVFYYEKSPKEITTKCAMCHVTLMAELMVYWDGKKFLDE